MAAPVDSARQGTNITSAGTSHSINVGSPTEGTLLIVAVRFAGNPGTVTFTGYTSLVSDASDASDDTTQIFYRDADGTEGATDTLSTTNSIKLSAICWEITGAETAAHSAPTRSTVAVGTTAANGADPSSASVTGGPLDTLYLAIMALDGEGNAPTVAPTNYSNLETANSGTGGSAASNCSIGGASREVAASSSEDPGNFTHAGANAGWTAFTVAVHEPGDFATDANRAVTDTGSSDTTTPTFNVPSGVTAGQHLVLIWRAGGNVNSITDAGGFTQLVLSSADGTDDDFYVGYKVADGTEGSTIQQTVSNGRRFAGIMYRIENGDTPTLSSVGTGSGTSVDPALYNPGAGVINGLWIAIGSCEDARTVSAYPSPYINGTSENVSTGSEGATIMAASRQVQSSQVNPNPFTINTTSNNHMHAVLAFAPSAAQQFNQSLDAAVTLAATAAKSVGKSLSVAIALAITLTKSVTKTLTAASPLEATLTAARAFLRTLSAEIPVVPTMTRSVTKTLESAVAMAAAITKSVTKTLAVEIPVAATQAAFFVVLLSLNAAVTLTATMTRSVGKLLSSAIPIEATQTAIKVILVTLDAAVALVATMTRSVGKVLEAPVPIAVAMTRSAGKTLTVALAPVATLTKSVTKTLSAAVVMVATLEATRAFLQTLEAAVTVAATMTRSVGKTLSAAVTVAATMTRSVGKTLSAAVTTAATLTRSYGKTLTVEIPVAATQAASKAFLRSLDAAVTVSVTMSRQIAKTLSVAISIVARIPGLANVVLGFFDRPSPGGRSGRRAPTAAAYDDGTPGGNDVPSPDADFFDPPSPGGRSG